MAPSFALRADRPARVGSYPCLYRRRRHPTPGSYGVRADSDSHIPLRRTDLAGRKGTRNAHMPSLAVIHSRSFG